MSSQPQQQQLSTPTSPTSPTTTTAHPSTSSTTSSPSTSTSSPSQSHSHSHQPPQSPTTSQRTAEARTAFTASLKSVGANYETELRDRARNLHDNAAAISKQETDLQRATAELGKQNDQWTKVADQAREGLKEIGDVQNWAELIERDLLLVEETLRIVEEEDEREGRVEGEGENGSGNGDLNGNGSGKGKKKADPSASTSGWLKWW